MAGAADIGEFVDVEGHARSLQRAFHVPGSAGHGERQAIGGDALVDVIHRDDAGGALHVLHDDAGLARDEACQMAGDDACRVVDAAARRKTDDDGERLALIKIAGARFNRTSRHCKTGNGSH